VGAIAVSKREEQQIERLRRTLRIPTKSGLIRAALRTLEKKTEEERLRREIQESVRRCRAADKKENCTLFPAGVAHRISGD
jgi:Arc/MetJ-type ribon-helix-helix transcriptional regulator